MGERAEREYRPPKRWKSVQVGFFGMGIEDPRGAGGEADGERLTEAELDDLYRDAARRNRLSWVLYALAALAILGLLAWQIFRAD